MEEVELERDDDVAREKTKKERPEVGYGLEKPEDDDRKRVNMLLKNVLLF